MTNSILNITNGDSAVAVLRAAQVAGDFLPWRDVLHEGPVPAGLTLAQLSARRADYVAARGWADAEQAAADFRARDQQLRDHARYSRVVLWFEHDLYDQLQILQLLDWLSRHRAPATELSMICTEQYLGLARPQDIGGLIRCAAPVSPAQLDLAAIAWSAFRAPSPESWCDLLDRDTSALPFLRAAIERMIEEFPACTDGLSRTARQALRLIAAGEARPGRLFAGYQATEQRRFLGDSSFWAILQRMLDSRCPLIESIGDDAYTVPPRPGQALGLSAAGREVLGGGFNWLDRVDVECWLGGVHLTAENMWCARGERLYRRGGMATEARS